MDKIYSDRENYESPFLQKIKNMKSADSHKIYQRIDKRIYFKKSNLSNSQKTLTLGELFTKLHIFNPDQYGNFIVKMKYLSKQYEEKYTIIIFWDGLESDFKLPENEPKIINYNIFYENGELKRLMGAKFTYKKVFYYSI